MFAGVKVFRHSLLNSGLKPCTYTLISNVGVRGGFSPSSISGSIAMFPRLGSTLPAHPSKFTWKPLRDPEAKKQLLKRVAVVGSITVLIAGGCVWMFYTMKYDWPSDPPRVAEIRKGGINKV